MPSLLDLHAVDKRFGDKLVLNAVDLSVPRNACVCVLGPSGSGKTTLLRVIAGFEQPDGGHLVLDGRRIDDVPAYRRNIGFVFQNFALFPHLSVEDNVGFGLEHRAATPMPAAERRDRVRAMIELVGLSGLERRDIAQISGGQRQRVALARTLVTEPSLVLLDEPLGALDANLRTRMRDELRLIRERLGVTFLHVTGSEAEALAMGDTVVVLDAGTIAQVGDADAVYNRPCSPAVARFLNCYNIFAGRLEGEEFVGALGRFAARDARSAVPRRRAESAPAYAIRQDRIIVRPADAELAAGEAGIAAVFVASEYAGASVLSFFRLDDGRVVDVEDHLSLRAPPVYAEKQRYRLVWKSRDALVFP
ncbi:ABC transporter ATP-binding protein [Labrys wisconsinensis]|uniref:Spermidine/putrescine transport system ATP-binding protein n=1 Tax=Labrys wisconsinensis TaxID=425677 RepID=A0ABU0JDJ6_9HYPH|nr:ABC transporter ATP-binding protein [Labrys wisconsinensis]MDQ0471478.1 putative spermidine/putrescine transport system ATP-binding protein [Labrys wisconsinensis]